jgi:microcystin-dependent protein
MSSPYLSEIRLVAFSFPPKGWALCNGQILSIQQNSALFALLGTTFGGNGVQTFALPNLQGRAALCQGTGGGSSYVMGEVGGEVNVTLNTQQIPLHTHQVQGTSATANLKPAAGNVSAVSSDNPFATTSNATMSPNALSNAGGSQPHSNMPPYLVMNYIIALAGIFPSRN